MCIEDIAISRRCYVKTTSTAAGVVTELPANPDRLAVVVTLSNTGNTGACIAPTSADATADRGWITVANAHIDGSNIVGTAFCAMSYEDWGPIVQGKLFVRVTLVDQIIGEIIMMPELAAEVAALARKWTK